ncbi:MAG: hypothetical protein OXF22_07935 [Anaerolineaceae bacterium]|nr:hypothetical protein [Anaerolineaceae bacterium]
MRRGIAQIGYAFVGIFIILALSNWLPSGDDAAEDPFQADAIRGPQFPSFTYGIQAFLWWDEYVASLALHWVKEAQFSHVKQFFAWQDLQPHDQTEWLFERSDEIVTETEEKEVALVIRLGGVPKWARRSQDHSAEGEEVVDSPPAAEYTSAWAEYCGRVAQRYAGRIAGYQIWNEPNLAREWGGGPVSASEYIELLKACSAAIRKYDRQTIIISAGFAPTGTNDPQVAIADDVFLRQLYEGEFQQYIDVLGAHAVGYTAPEFSPELAETITERGRWASFRRIEDLRKIMIEEGDAHRQMAILEMGWTTDPRPESQMAWFAVDEQTQAEYFYRAFLYAEEHWRPWVGLITLIYIADPAWTIQDEKYWWSLIRFHDDPRYEILTPAFHALREMPKVCDRADCP